MFSEIINDLVKDVEGASLSEKLLGAPAHKFYVTPKDMYLRDRSMISVALGLYLEILIYSI